MSKCAFILSALACGCDVNSCLKSLMGRARPGTVRENKILMWKAEKRRACAMEFVTLGRDQRLNPITTKRLTD